MRVENSWKLRFKHLCKEQWEKEEMDCSHPFQCSAANFSLLSSAFGHFTETERRIALRV